jgi:site-specific recombinase XerD
MAIMPTNKKKFNNMKARQTILEDLTTQAVDYLQKLSFSDSRVGYYLLVWKKLSVFMKANNLQYYDADVGDKYIYHIIGERPYSELRRGEKDTIQCVNSLTEFQQTGTIKLRKRKRTSDFTGAIGLTMKGYIAYRKSIFTGQATVELEESFLYRFSAFLNKSNINSINEIDKALINGFTSQLGFYALCSRKNYCKTVKFYLKYLYDKKIIKEDFSRHVPQIHYPNQPKLPLPYTQEEVESLLSAVDRSSPKGKRDYAMILLTAKLGLRAFDVSHLKFENLHWEQNQIVLTQQKTGKRIELPLLQDIGEAIIDYLKYGRPVSDLPEIFLYASPPYDCVGKCTLHSIISTYMRIAGIKFSAERGHGPHALRHSLAGLLLKKKTPLHVISEVLGHKNTESTRHYLRIDITSLRQCALEVPAISAQMNNQGERRMNHE